MRESLIETYRYFLKDSVRLTIDFKYTGQNRNVPPPPIEKPYDPDARRIKLTAPNEMQGITNVDVFSAIAERKSRRNYSDDPLTSKELSFLLWATAGIKKQLDAGHALRTVPSAGCRHAIETYVYVFNVEGIKRGMYRYLPLEHELLFMYTDEKASEKIAKAAMWQSFVGKSAATFFWTAVPYRMEWRYDIAAAKVIALDAGHICQNLYLACEAVDAGTCGIGAYFQEEMDRLLQIDGEEEFAIYLAPVGRKLKRDTGDRQ